MTGAQQDCGMGVNNNQRTMAPGTKKYFQDTTEKLHPCNRNSISMDKTNMATAPADMLATRLRANSQDSSLDGKLIHGC